MIPDSIGTVTQPTAAQLEWRRNNPSGLLWIGWPCFLVFLTIAAGGLYGLSLL